MKPAWHNGSYKKESYNSSFRCQSQLNNKRQRRLNDVCNDAQQRLTNDSLELATYLLHCTIIDKRNAEIRKRFQCWQLFFG